MMQKREVRVTDPVEILIVSGTSAQARVCLETNPGVRVCYAMRALGGLQLALSVVDATGASMLQYVGKKIEEDSTQAKRCAVFSTAMVIPSL